MWLLFVIRKLGFVVYVVIILFGKFYYLKYLKVLLSVVNLLNYEIGNEINVVVFEVLVIEVVFVYN